MIKHIYYINLEKDIERRDTMDAQLKRVFPQTPFSRFSAFDREYVIKNREAIAPRVNGTYLEEKEDKFPRPGAIGCYLSHERILENIINSPNGYLEDDVFMVLEDDCKISSAFPDYFVELLTSLRNVNFEWTVLKPVCRKSDELHKVNDYLYKTAMSSHLDHNYYFGAHMLLYNARNLNKLCIDLKRRKLKDIDYVLNKEIDGVFAFKLKWPEMIWQDNYGGSNTTDNQPWSAIK